MRRARVAAAACVTLLIVGCGKPKVEESGAPAAPAAAEEKVSSKPIPPSQTFYAAQQAFQGGAVSGSGADPGRVVFDGDKRTQADLSAPAVSAPAVLGPDGKTVVYTAPARDASLQVGEPPLPGASIGGKAGGGQGQVSARSLLAKADASGGTGPGTHAPGGSQPSVTVPASDPICGPDMATLPGFCIDRWEASTVDKKTGQPLSPYYSPDPNPKWPGAIAQHGRWAAKPAKGYELPEFPDLQKSGLFEPLAVSKPGVYPQGFVNRASAERACVNAGKRLCTRREWYLACVGPGADPSGGYRPAFPYGAAYEKGKCNYHVVPGHPLMILGRSSSQLDDPRLMLAETGGRRLLARTGEFSGCTNAYGVYDMVGNQDEVVSDKSGENMTFVGSFYSRSQKTPQGCASSIGVHHALYYDYSIGLRCCKDR